MQKTNLMKSIQLLLFSIFLLMSTPNYSDKVDLNLSDLKWKNRVVVVFAEHEEGAHYKTQINGLRNAKDGIKERDVVIISIFKDGESNIDGLPLTELSSQKIHEKLNSNEQSFAFILIGKDGGVKMREQQVVTPGDLFTVIDRMPMRQREKRKY